MNRLVPKTKLTDSSAAQEHSLPAPAYEPNPVGETFHLQRRQHLKLPKAAGWSVKALTGSVWITLDGDIRDIVLEAGDSVVLDRDAPALFSSFGDASFRLRRDNHTIGHHRIRAVATPLSSPPTGALPV